MVGQPEHCRAEERGLHSQSLARGWTHTKDASFFGDQVSEHSHMRELRIQHEGRPYRVLYAFDARRAAILLIGGDKTGNDRWYEEYVPLADAIYDQHLRELENE